ncbi:MAG: limonene-1,2-epoxide hydrolase [Actinobacteria bacterium RBG_13_35_12]|uniref:Limonene-1,2-epoxide hydrolase n=1 Tax=Candidatus Sediminicultor quintus TaxID=1797291 RepID=A0A1F5A5B6_9BACT|nr:MAG: limonene-1,2-epoxide hydrolase [Actinobacteria bacterium RBG_13_35_12]OGD13782.1 MAG: limonene-1,2-epoxide hydrolase [Candidatus Atribacteria bacterium RBG_19FT_COMBO_35_14]
MNNNFNLFSLSTIQIKELWSKTYNRDGKTDWSHIFPYYHEEIVFKDTIQKIVGIDEFKNLCDRLTARCQQLKMNIPSIVMENNIIFMDWEMTMIFKKFPSSTIYGSTKLTLHQDGRIIEQRDYYDLWGDIFDNIPWFAKSYRKFMKKKFG